MPIPSVVTNPGSGAVRQPRSLAAPHVRRCGPSSTAESETCYTLRVSFIAKPQRGREILEQRRRISVGALGRELGGDELDELVEELVDVQRVARREGTVLQWPAQSEHKGAGGWPAVTGPGATPPLAGARKVATVVFADLAGSTALHEVDDLDAALARFEELRPQSSDTKLAP